MKDSGVTVYRCRWCGHRVWGVFGWFHKPSKCDKRRLCETCNGRGMVDYFDRQRLVTDEEPCPDCVAVS